MNKSPKEMWDNEIVPFIKEITETITYDAILLDQLETLCIKIDSDFANDQSIVGRVDAVAGVIASPGYYMNAMPRASQAEIDKLILLADQLFMLDKVASYDPEKETMVEDPTRLPNEEVTMKTVYGVEKKQRMI